MDSIAALVVAVAAMAAVMPVGGDFAADKAECSEKLVALSVCLTYVQAGAQVARMPTPDCCSGLKAVLQSSRKCLCVLVRDRDEPGLGIKINVTRALALPSVCAAPSNVSDCPRLLNLAPGSKDAEVFEQFGKQQAAPPAAAGGGGGAPPASAQKSDAARMRWLGADGVGGVAVALFFPLAIIFFFQNLQLVDECM